MSQKNGAFIKQTNQPFKNWSMLVQYTDFIKTSNLSGDLDFYVFEQWQNRSKFPFGFLDDYLNGRIDYEEVC